jgi:hypothetical protein
MLRQLYGAVFLLVLPLCLAVSGTSADEISGTYRNAATLQATLEVRRQTGDYLVRREGGASAADGAATPADCVIEARGALEGDVLHARFGPVETEIFSYSAAQAEREGRVVEIVFEPGRAQVVQADTLGYCGLGVEFAGSYRKVEESADMTSPPPTSATMFLQDMLGAAGRDAHQMRKIQALIRAEMEKHGVPGDISVADFVRRPDPRFEQQRQEVAKALGWRP